MGAAHALQPPPTTGMCPGLRKASSLMPMYLPPISRRRFLAGSLAAGAGLLSGRLVEARTSAPALSTLVPKIAAPAFDPHRLALISDTHIDARLSKRSWGVNMADNLRQVCGEVLGLNTRPAAVLVN